MAMIAFRLLSFLVSEIRNSKLAQGVLLAVVIMGAASFGMWRLHHAGYTKGYSVAQDAAKKQLADLRASYEARIVAANAKADATIKAWQEASDKLQAQYLSEKAKADATQQKINVDLAQSPGADAVLPPYLGRAAGMLYGTTGAAH